MSTVCAGGLVVSVRFLTGRYHGEPEWPPSPARLFQALVVASGLSHRSDSDASSALRWLESLPAPAIAAPIVCRGQSVKLYVPNNDMDSVGLGAEPKALADIRTAKVVQPRLFDANTPLIYSWSLAEDSAGCEAKDLCELAQGVYQLGRGVDMAWATGEILDSDALDELLAHHPGRIFRPALGSSRGRSLLACPRPGSLDSLKTRYEATLKRFHFEDVKSKRMQVFRQPPKARFTPVAYDTPPHRMLFDLRASNDSGSFVVTRIFEIARMTEMLRDHAAARLTRSLKGQGQDIERALIGRRVEGLTPLAPDTRIRLAPLPSVGHTHVDRGIRRLLVEVPSGGPLSAEDVFWAFSGLSLDNPEGVSLVVTRADDQRMLKHYGVDPPECNRTWRTVTPAVLPSAVARCRIDPARISADVKGVEERGQEEASAADAVLRSLRHALLPTDVEAVRVQREPFDSKSGRAETFAPNTRFAKERLWHVEVLFRKGIRGPVVIGDGRFLGLGLMQPVREPAGVMVFEIVSGLKHGARADVVAAALRRAVMARYQAEIGGRQPLPPFISGHDTDGGPANERHPHLFFVFDSRARRLLVVSPHIRDWLGSVPKDHMRLRTLADALAGFVELRAGSAGRLGLRETALSADNDRLFSPSQRWVSQTPYVVNRHLNRASLAETLSADIQRSCRAAGLPTPRVVVIKARSEPRIGVMGFAELQFDVAVRGPLLLGRTRHRGGGLFGRAEPST